MGNELLASKISIIETEPKVRNIVGASTSVASAVGVTERGPVGSRVKVTSPEEFDNTFGGVTADAFDLPMAVRAFFAEGGSEIYVTRTVHFTDITNAASATSNAATIDFVTAALGASAGAVLGTVAETYSLVDGDTLTVNVDAGGDLTATFNVTAGSQQSVNAETYALSDGQTLLIAVDGGSAQTVTFNTAEFGAIGAATAAEVAAVINGEATGVQTTAPGGDVLITSDLLGTGSSIEITGGTASAAFAFPAGAASGTGDAADSTAVTVAELKILIEGDIAGLTVSDSGGAVLVTSNTTGASSSIGVNATSTLDTKLGLSNATNFGAAAGAVSTLRANGKTDGTYGNSVSVEIANATSGEADEFNMLVYESGVLAEVFPNVSMTDTDTNYVETVVNDTESGSVLVAMVDLDAARTAPSDRPVNTTSTLAGGDDGLSSLDDNDFIGSSISKVGIRSFDEQTGIALLMVPGRATASVHSAMVTYCELTRAGSIFPVLDPPAGLSTAQMITYVKTTANLKELSEFGAVYWPRILVDNPDKALFGSGRTVTVAPAGHICGMYARTDGARPGGVYEAPAGVETGRLLTMRGVENKEVNDELKRDLLYPELINPIVSIDGLPNHVDGVRTLKSGGNFPTIGERRGVIFIEESLRSGYLPFKFKKIKNSTLQALTRTSTAFLVTQTRNDAFASDIPAEAFYVDFSAALNPATVAFQRKIIGRIGLATGKPAEFIQVFVSADTRALDAELAEIEAAVA